MEAQISHRGKRGGRNGGEVGVAELGQGVVVFGVVVLQILDSRENAASCGEPDGAVDVEVAGSGGDLGFDLFLFFCDFGKRASEKPSL